MSDTLSLAKKYRISTPENLAFDAPILVVEDQTDLRLIIVHQLRKLAFSNVAQAGNGYEALEKMREAPGLKPQAVICDMEMPVMGGLDLLNEMREGIDLDRGPFCITMDNVSKEKIMLAVEHGCEEILVKPFTLNDIRPKLIAAFRKFHNPSNPEKLYEAAKLGLRREKLEISQSIYADLARAAPTAARPVVGLARIAVKKENYDEALQLLAKAEQKNPNYIHLYAERGKILAIQKDWVGAVAAFRKAIELSPLNAIRYKEAADVLFRVQRYTEAAELLEAALSYHLSFPDLYHYLSQAKFALKDYKAAGKYVRSALNSDPDNVNYLNQLGICLKEEGNTDEAQRVYNHIIKLDPGNTAALFNKAILQKKRGQIEEAIKILERLVRKQPDFKPAKTKLDEYLKEQNQGAA